MRRIIDLANGNEETKVLIVDDDFHFNNDVLTYHLQRLGGYHVLNAFTIVEFKRQAFDADIIILDIRLPEDHGKPFDPWGGLKALRELNERDNLTEADKKSLSAVILRSAFKKGDAEKANIQIPEHYDWIDINAPLSQLTNALEKLANKIRQGDLSDG